MPLKIPLTYNSEKNKKFGEILLKIGTVIFSLGLLTGLIYSIYIGNYIWIGAFGAGCGAALIYFITELIRNKKSIS